ncbi:hypothetical protein PSHT_12100 [Puccinia striiformis]|uniref:Phosphomannomutase n=1 Tax=Puccinia striiformis TaxID=27350 RepID=A0A2S4UYW5_9BASI|nr:hypothetical protein PSHT_12100 [Puccinia striiformis]
MTTDFSARPLGSTLVLFDVDGTLTPARRTASPEILTTLEALRKKAVIGFVGGSDLVKIREQLEVTPTANGTYPSLSITPSYIYILMFVFVWRRSVQEIGQFLLREISELDIPIKRGTFIEFRNGMINVSPIGRNASVTERDEFEKYDKETQIRSKLVEKLKTQFPEYGLTFSIGGQISFDVFPTGWDKTYALKHVEDQGFKEIHFFGDKTYKGGNDHEIYEDSRTVGHPVTCPEDTIKILKELFHI